jgi:hypothetical protein
MPASRFRTVGYDAGGGTRTNLHAGGIEELRYSSLDVCADTVGGYPDPFGLWIERLDRSVGCISGEVKAFPVYHYDSYPLDYQGGDWSHLIYGNSDPHFSSAQVAAYITQAEADTNPSRPDVSVPNFIYELKDLPGMLHKKGREHSKRHRQNSAVEQNFGWYLLWRDLSAMIDFTASVNKRMKELKGLYKGSGLHRLRRLGSNAFGASEAPGIFHSSDAFVLGHIQVTMHERWWATVRWVPDPSGLLPSEDELVRRARLAVHGWDFSSSGVASVLWEAIPWSWFADYFGNMGSFLAANRNSVGASPAAACVMRTISTTRQGVIEFVSPGCTATAPRMTFVDKIRQVGVASLTASLTILSPKQLVTLSSIAYNIAKPL